MEQAKAVLKQFLPRFNRRFRVPAQCPDSAFRPLPPDLRLEQVLCFKHRRRVERDNTVKFHRHILQLLPGQQLQDVPVRLSLCCRDWTAGCRYNMRDASLLLRRHRPVREFYATATRLPRSFLYRP